RAPALPHHMRGCAAHHEDWLTREREFPHRMVDLLGDSPGPGAVVEPRQLIEQQPELPVIGFDRLNRTWTGKNHQRCIWPVSTTLRNVLRELIAENLGIQGIKKEITQLVLAVACDSKHAGKWPRLAAHLRFEL